MEPASTIIAIVSRCLQLKQPLAGPLANEIVNDTLHSVVKIRVKNCVFPR